MKEKHQIKKGNFNALEKFTIFFLVYAYSDSILIVIIKKSMQ